MVGCCGVFVATCSHAINLEVLVKFAPRFLGRCLMDIMDIFFATLNKEHFNQTHQIGEYQGHFP